MTYVEPQHHRDSTASRVVADVSTVTIFRWFDVLGKLMHKPDPCGGELKFLIDRLLLILAKWWTGGQGEQFPGHEVEVAACGVDWLSYGCLWSDRLIVIVGVDPIGIMNSIMTHVWKHVLPLQMSVVIWALTDRSDVGRLVRHMSDRQKAEGRWRFDVNCFPTFHLAEVKEDEMLLDLPRRVLCLTGDVCQETVHNLETVIEEYIIHVQPVRA